MGTKPTKNGYKSPTKNGYKSLVFCLQISLVFCLQKEGRRKAKILYLIGFAGFQSVHFVCLFTLAKNAILLCFRKILYVLYMYIVCHIGVLRLPCLTAGRLSTIKGEKSSRLRNKGLHEKNFWRYFLVVFETLGTCNNYGYSFECDYMPVKTLLLKVIELANEQLIQARGTGKKETVAVTREAIVAAVGADHTRGAIMDAINDICRVSFETAHGDKTKRWHPFCNVSYRQQTLYLTYNADAASVLRVLLEEVA